MSRGGKREGAGRKPDPLKENTTITTIKIENNDLNKIREHIAKFGGNVNAYIAKAVKMRLYN